MKQIKLAVIALFMLVSISNLSAQDENNPWRVGFGINSVDFTHWKVTELEHYEDYLGSNNDWNILPSISRISVGRYLSKGFSVELAGSINKIDVFRNVDDSDYLYYSADASVLYDLNNIIGETSWFDPFVRAGASYVNSDSESDAMLTIGAGFNTWFNDNLGLSFNSGGKLGVLDNVKSHWQHSIGLVVKFGGKDSDKDGINDKDDECPQVAGLKEFNGCPDADGDGVKDSADACPNVAGLVAMNGCPDADGDGIADKNDACPNVKGTKATKGCPDADKDGIADKDDKCPKVAGVAANGGCPWKDTDGDSVLDKDDKCPQVAGVASNNGCPEVSKAVQEYKAVAAELNFAAKSILFNTARSTFKPGVTRKLDEMIVIMNKFSNSEFIIEGHADSVGSSASNMILSNNRANRVKKYLVSKGISASRLSTRGFGEDAPIDTNATRAGRANNRRVVIKVAN
ncbi:OmpA family protein [uncultured Polaribacter sp.]|uniref:OmpA family protein n=1 Tax=uncultured Polaribacter sp. TaxID=174711 RepID=UPI002611E177|nr:OmpA family protein [uncultured Polaribacter sp.]